MSVQRVPCTLCDAPVVWVEGQDDGKRFAIDPEPQEFGDGVYARVNPKFVGGKEHVVYEVPEGERWMKNRLYRKHTVSCRRWQLCKQKRMSFQQCLEQRKIEKAPVLSQSAREAIAPASEYMLNRNL